MNINSIITPTLLTKIIHNFEVTHFYTDPKTDEDGEAILFVEETCATCGAKCRGANPIILKFSPGQELLTRFGLKRSFALDDLYADENGDDECAACPVLAKGR